MNNIEKNWKGVLIVPGFVFFITIYIIIASIPTPVNEAISIIKTDLFANREKYMFIIEKIKEIKTRSKRYYMHRNSNVRKFQFEYIDTTSHEDFSFPKEIWIPTREREIYGVLVSVNDYISFNKLMGYLNENLWLCYYFNDFVFKESRFAQDSILYYSGENMPKVKIRWLYQIDKNWIIYSR